MTSRTCDMCECPIPHGAPAAQMHVPLAYMRQEDDNDYDNSRMVSPISRRGIYYKSFDVCLGCARILQLKPTERTALDEAERIAMEKIK